jgi:hypothetical protein
VSVFARQADRLEEYKAPPGGMAADAPSPVETGWNNYLFCAMTVTRGLLGNADFAAARPMSARINATWQAVYAI